MNDLPVDTMIELARTHERRAKALWKQHDRAISPTTRASLALKADWEQRAAIHFTMRVRNLRPQPRAISA
jgi:hypothetical protein